MSKGYKIESLRLALEELRKIDSEMPLQVAVVFCVVALAGELGMAELTNIVGIAQSSISRNVAALSKINRFHRPGHELLETREDPMSRSRKNVSLSVRGQGIAASLENLLSR
jgi:DNA-binding MarR family transcriptional regulator